MSDQRYSPSVKVDDAIIFINITAAIQAGQTDAAWAQFNANLIPLSNMGGAMNSQLPKPPTDPLAAFYARQAVSQNCAWVNVTPTESQALRDKYGAVVSDYNNFYTVGGSGGLGVSEPQDGASPSGWSFWKTLTNGQQQLTPDVNQAADAYVAQMAAEQGRTVPPPIGS